MNDKQFYAELIRQCEVVLPMVNEINGLCLFASYDEKNNILGKVVFKISHTTFRVKGNYHYSKIPNRSYEGYRHTPAWKQDRVELLDEIINYCKSKL